MRAPRVPLPPVDARKRQPRVRPRAGARPQAHGRLALAVGREEAKGGAEPAAVALELTVGGARAGVVAHGVEPPHL
eukprot:6265506-Prymnesium_polylepis.1